MEQLLYFMIMKLNKFILGLFLLLACVQIHAQNPTEKIKLSTFISSTEIKFEVKFSYAVEDVKTILISVPKEELNLKETIDFLNQNTSLNFKILDDRYIAVSKLNKTISICGIIRSSNEKQALFGASIAVQGKTLGTVSDVDGRFELDKVPINSEISISFLGFQTLTYKSQELDISTYGCRGILLNESNEILNQVFITKFLTTGLQKRLDGSIVLNTEQFGILPGLIEPDVLQSIQALPGVESKNESIANINVRGGNNDQNLMIWDDIKMYHSGHFFGLISAYNPHITEQVIVTKNGTSSEYSDGVSSTINMFTKDEFVGKFTGGAGINGISGDAFFQIPVSDKLELHVSGRRSFTDVFATPTYDNYFERSFQDSEINTQMPEGSEVSSTFIFYDYTAKLLYNLNEKHKFRANFIGIHNNLDYAEILTNGNSTETKNSNLEQSNLGFSSNFQSTWSDKWSSKLSVSFSNYTVNARDKRVETNQLLQQENEVLEIGVKLKTNYKLNNNLILLNGYQYNETGILNRTEVSAPAFQRTKKDVLRNHALFSEVEYKNKTTYARLGVRLNYFEKFDKLLIEPRVNIRQHISNSISLKLEGEFKNQSATQIVDFQDDFLGVENRRWILANDDNIPISTSQQGSFGIEYDHNNLHLGATAFYKFVEGITASNQGFYNNFQFINATGDYEAKGIEFLANKTALNYSAWISYTVSENNYNFESFTPSRFPNNVDIRHSVSAAFNYDIIQDLKLAVGGIWRSGLPYTKPLEGNETVQNGNTTFVNYDTPNSENLNEFIRWDVSITYQFELTQSSKASLSLGIRNITNSKNVLNRYYEVDPDDSNKALMIDNLSLQFTPNASFRVRF